MEIETSTEKYSEKEVLWKNVLGKTVVKVYETYL